MSFSSDPTMMPSSDTVEPDEETTLSEEEEVRIEDEDLQGALEECLAAVNEAKTKCDTVSAKFASRIEAHEQLEKKVDGLEKINLRLQKDLNEAMKRIKKLEERQDRGFRNRE